MMDRRKKPVEQIDFRFEPPAIEHFTLGNGLKVYFVERRHLPVLRINLVVDAGSKFDPSQKEGTANLLTMAFDEGAGELNALELSDEFELLGSNFDSACNHDNIYLSLRSLRENFNKSLKLFTDVVLRPHLDDVSFAREKRKIITRVMQLKDEPDEIANQVFEYKIFGSNDPYASPIAGTEKSIQNIKCKDIRQFYNRYIVPGNSSIIAIGDISREELSDKLNSSFKDWKGDSESGQQEDPAPESSFQIFLVNKKNAVQTEIRCGHYTGIRDEKYFPKMILNSILGGQFSSRINLNLREKKGYTYGASSNFNYYKDRGYFVVSTSVNRENSCKAVMEILHELNEIKKGVTPEELSFTKSSVLRKFPASFETNRQIAMNLSRLILYSLPLNHFSTYPGNVSSVTLNDVNEAAVSGIHPDKLYIVLVGDKDTILGQFKGSGLGPVTELDIEGNLLD